MTELVIVGGGEHARVVIEAARSRPDEWQVLGFLDSQACEATQRLGVPRLGGDEEAARLMTGDRRLALGVGSIGVTSTRQRVVEQYRALADRWATIVHGRAWVSPTAQLGPGTVVLAGALVNAATVVGPHCVINTGAIVEHDCRLGAFAQVAPGAVVGGGAQIGAGSFLGLGCRVRDHLIVGERAMIAMGAVVTAAVAAEAVVAGVPAKPLGRSRHG